MPSTDFVFNKYTKVFPNTTRNARSVFNNFGSLYAYDGANVSPGDVIKYRRRMSPTPIHARSTQQRRMNTRGELQAGDNPKPQHRLTRIYAHRRCQASRGRRRVPRRRRSQAERASS